MIKTPPPLRKRKKKKKKICSFAPRSVQLMRRVWQAAVPRYEERKERRRWWLFFFLPPSSLHICPITLVEPDRATQTAGNVSSPFKSCRHKLFTPHVVWIWSWQHHNYRGAAKMKGCLKRPGKQSEGWGWGGGVQRDTLELGLPTRLLMGWFVACWLTKWERNLC